MQEAVDSPNCPHFVTGSALSILAREIIGRGSLFGRFHSKPIATFSNYWGAELAKRIARYYQADLPELMAPSWRLAVAESFLHHRSHSSSGGATNASAR